MLCSWSGILTFGISSGGYGLLNTIFATRSFAYEQFLGSMNLTDQAFIAWGTRSKPPTFNPARHHGSGLNSSISGHWTSGTRDHARGR